MVLYFLFIMSETLFSSIICTTPKFRHVASLVIATITSSFFLGFSKTDSNFKAALFWMPIMTYKYSKILIRRPWLLVLYLLVFYIAKKINDRN